MLWHSILIAVLVLFIGWLARHRHKKHETQIRAIKTNLREEVQKTCEAADKGDTNAAMKLEAFKDALTEQSVRLTGRPKPPSTVIKGGIPGL